MREFGHLRRITLMEILLIIMLSSLVGVYLIFQRIW